MDSQLPINRIAWLFADLCFPDAMSAKFAHEIEVLSIDFANEPDDLSTEFMDDAEALMAEYTQKPIESLKAKLH
jgi:hypothetical protein